MCFSQNVVRWKWIRKETVHDLGSASSLTTVGLERSTVTVKFSFSAFLLSVSDSWGRGFRGVVTAIPSCSAFFLSSSISCWHQVTECVRHNKTHKVARKHMYVCRWSSAPIVHKMWCYKQNKQWTHSLNIQSDSGRSKWNAGLLVSLNLNFSHKWQVSHASPKKKRTHKTYKLLLICTWLERVT